MGLFKKKKVQQRVVTRMVTLRNLDDTERVQAFNQYGTRLNVNQLWEWYRRLPENTEYASFAEYLEGFITCGKKQY